MRPYSQCLPASCASVQIMCNGQFLVGFVCLFCFVSTQPTRAAFFHPSTFHTTWLLSYPDSWLSSSTSLSPPLCKLEVLWILCLVVFFFSPSSVLSSVTISFRLTSARLIFTTATPKGRTPAWMHPSTTSQLQELPSCLSDSIWTSRTVKKSEMGN